MTVGFLLCLALSGLPANSGPCSSSILVFTRTDAQREARVSVNTAGPACAVPGGDAVDGRLVLPQSVDLAVRYTRDLGASVSTLTATVNGLGFSSRAMTLQRAQDPTTLQWAYNGAFETIPGGPDATGRVTVTIVHGSIPGGSDSTCYRTVTGACP